MANRHLLCQQNIEDFRAFLIEKGYIVEKPVGEYEELRAKRPGEKNPVIVYRRVASNGGGPLVHFTVQDRDVPLVTEFFKRRKQVKAYRLYDIEYDIEPEDVEDSIDEEMYALNSDYVKACEDKVDYILETLPSEIEVCTDKEFEVVLDLEDFLSDAITDKTGYLVKSYKYERRNK